MSKKSKRAKRGRPITHFQQRPSVRSQSNDELAGRAHSAQQQMRRGDFAGCIGSCEPLLNSLPKDSETHMEVLVMLGLAHGMLHHYQQSSDVFREGIRIDPTRAELWYNHGLACHYMGRHAEAVRDLERAFELSKNEKSDIARKIAAQLEVARQELQEAMDAYEGNITVEKYTEREERFAQALSLMKQQKWPEAELLFRQLGETESNVPSYWGNLGVSLMMQDRYDEAEEAFKQALVIDPDYLIARNNLKKLPKARRSKEPLAMRIINQSREEDVEQSLALYEHDDEGDITDCTVIEKVGHTMTGTWRQIGKQPPRYHLFLNRYQDTRFTTCPRCNIKTHLRTFTLVIHVNPASTAIVDKTCRFCDTCSLLIVHKDELEERLATTLMKSDPEAIGNDYLIVGTVDRAQLNRARQKPASFDHVVKCLHDFKEVVKFERVSEEVDSEHL